MILLPADVFCVDMWKPQWCGSFLLLLTVCGVCISQPGWGFPLRISQYRMNLTVSFLVTLYVCNREWTLSLWGLLLHIPSKLNELGGGVLAQYSQER